MEKRFKIVRAFIAAIQASQQQEAQDCAPLRAVPHTAGLAEGDHRHHPALVPPPQAQVSLHRQKLRNMAQQAMIFTGEAQCTSRTLNILITTGFPECQMPFQSQNGRLHGAC